MDRWARCVLFWGIIGLLLIIAVGGTTRLTRSGLSIVEWNVVMGTLPPVTESEWRTQFHKYQNTPEFKLINRHFTVNDYKKIYFWEWFHRLWARVLFLYFLGFGVFYLWKKKSAQIIAIAGLILLQGTVGWLMVKSGLRDQPRVQPLMLAIHFFLALSTLAAALYFRIGRRKKLIDLWLHHRSEIGLLAVLLSQVFLGCLVSGYRAGFLENTFPQMSAGFLPKISSPFHFSWSYLRENPVLFQLLHRWLAFAVMIYFWVLFIFTNKVRRPEWTTFNILLHSQILLGVLTLILKVPVLFGILHQLTAACLVLSYLHPLWMDFKPQLVRRKTPT